ncbi:MAG: ATP-binding protein [Polyangiales bacterium]
MLRRRLYPLAELEREGASGAAYRERLAALLARAEVQRVMPEVTRVLDDMGRATDTISSIVRDLHVFTRVDELEKPQRVDVHEIINQVLRLAGSRVTARGHVERDFAVELPAVYVPRSRLAQVLTNILVNAAQAIAEVDRPVHRVQVSTRADDEGIIIAVRDTGPGIAPEHLDRVFDPFFTTKKPGEGTGLGLALSSDLVRRMGGQLLVQSTFGEGATFMVYLPAAPEDAPYEPALPLPSWRPPANATLRRSVLVVDDDERVLRAYARVLRDDYDVLLASDGQEAIDLLRSGSRADLVITDLEMPEVDGLALIDWLRAERPELARRVVMATATPLAEIEDSGVESKVSALLGKPVSPAALLAACERALAVPGRGGDDLASRPTRWPRCAGRTPTRRGPRSAGSTCAPTAPTASHG